MIYYNCRIDVCTLNQTKEEFYEKFTKLMNTKFEKYIFCEEIGEKTKKVHLQGIVAVKTQYDDKELRNVRTLMKQLRNDKYKNDYSLTLAKNKTDLETYVMKSKNVVLKLGYDTEEIEQIMEKVEQFQMTIKKKNAPSFGRYLLDYVKQNEDEFILKAEPKKIEEVNKYEGYTKYIEYEIGFVKNRYINTLQLRNIIVRKFSEEVKKFNANVIDDFYNLVLSHYRLSIVQREMSESWKYRQRYNYKTRKNNEIEQPDDLEMLNFYGRNQ